MIAFRPAAFGLSLWRILGSGSSLRAGEPVKAKVNLLDVIKAGDVEYHVNPKADFHDDPQEIWTFQPDGTLKVSGRGYGYVATKQAETSTSSGAR